MALAAISVAAQSPRFDAATVKPRDPKAMNMMDTRVYPGGRIVISGQTLLGLIGMAFDVRFWQISGGEEWMRNNDYTVEALPPVEMRATLQNTSHSLFTIGDERLRQMLQALLMERFQLKFHRETKTGTVSLLQRNEKAPLLLTLSTSEAPGSIGWAEHWGMSNTTMEQLARFAGDFQLHRPVLDHTGLAGAFNYKGPHEDTDAYRADDTGSFLNMIHALGLKLESARGPVETFVIDQALEPSAN